MLTTDRLTLGTWQASDAGELLPILVANREHLSPWIPAHVATPLPVLQLAERLASDEEKFNSNVEWRYAMRHRTSRDLLGEVAMFPRSVEGRVALPSADRVEIGYWLRQDYNGSGLATEAVKALLGVARTFRQFGHTEIRCDPCNSPSVNVARRLGFVLEPQDDANTHLFVLQHSLND